MRTMEKDQEFGHEEPEASNAQPEGNMETEEKGRRDFLKQAGLLSVGAGLAHFVALGGPLRKAQAWDNDYCPWPHTPIHDTCRSDPSNYDEDVCKKAKLEGGGNVEEESGDDCRDDEWLNDPDLCNRNIRAVESGDECKPYDQDGNPLYDSDEPNPQ